MVFSQTRGRVLYGMPSVRVIPFCIKGLVFHCTTLYQLTVFVRHIHDKKNRLFAFVLLLMNT